MNTFQSMMKEFLRSEPKLFFSTSLVNINGEQRSKIN